MSSIREMMVSCVHPQSLDEKRAKAIFDLKVEKTMVIDQIDLIDEDYAKAKSKADASVELDEANPDMDAFEQMLDLAEEKRMLQEGKAFLNNSLADLNQARNVATGIKVLKLCHKVSLGTARTPGEAVDKMKRLAAEIKVSNEQVEQLRRGLRKNTAPTERSQRLQAMVADSKNKQAGVTVRPALGSVASAAATPPPPMPAQAEAPVDLIAL